MRFRAGTTHSFQATLSDYSGVGWVVYLLVNVGDAPARIDLTENGTVPGCWEGELTPTDSTEWSPACYAGTVIAEKDSKKYAPLEVELIVLPNPITGTGKTAMQTELELVNAAITAVLEKRGVQAYQIQTNIGTRQLQNMTLAELRQHRNWLSREVTKEQIKMGLKNKSEGGHRIIGTRFNR